MLLKIEHTCSYKIQQISKKTVIFFLYSLLSSPFHFPIVIVNHLQTFHRREIFCIFFSISVHSPTRTKPIQFRWKSLKFPPPYKRHTKMAAQFQSRTKPRFCIRVQQRPKPIPNRNKNVAFISEYRKTSKPIPEKSQTVNSGIKPESSYSSDPNAQFQSTTSHGKSPTLFDVIFHINILLFS